MIFRLFYLALIFTPLFAVESHQLNQEEPTSMAISQEEPKKLELLDLPDDVLTHIFSFLNLKSLKKTAETCKKLDSIIYYYNKEVLFAHYNILPFNIQRANKHPAPGYVQSLCSFSSSTHYYPSLRKYIIDAQEIKDADIEALLILFRSIRELDLKSFTNISNNFLCHIAHCIPLKKLVLDDCSQVTDQVLFAFASINTLDSLSLGWCKMITNEGIATLAQTSLKELDLTQCTQLTDEALIPFKDSDIEKLDIPYCLFSDHAMTSLAKCRNLKFLNIHAGLRIVGNHFHPGANITNQGIAALAQSKTLETLYIGDNPRLTDAVFNSLASVKSLKFLSVVWCRNMTPAGVNNFHNIRPDVTVDDMNVGRRF